MGFSGDSMGISWEMAKEFFFGVSQQKLLGDIGDIATEWGIIGILNQGK